MFGLKVDHEIELGLLEERHAEQLFALISQNRAQLRQWLGWLDGTTAVEDTKAFVRGSLQRFAYNNGFAAGIWYKGKLAGSIDFHSFDWTARQTAIGYWLAAGFEGKGIMTRSCRAMCDYAFGELGLNRVSIHAATGNSKSRAIPERLGFVQEGIARQSEWLYDHYVDLVAYSMLASDWKHNK